MSIQIDTPAKLAEWVRRAPSITMSPLARAQKEIRMYQAAAVIIVLLLVIEPQLYLYDVEESLIYRVARLAPSPYMVTGLFLAGLIACLPHLFSLIFMPSKLGLYWPRIWAAGGCFLISVTWIYLANLAAPLDLGSLSGSYLVRSAVTVVIGLFYAYSVNSQQARERAEQHAQEMESPQ
ncbi:hypothetical protein [uncultured Variovorax sp.]|uniref:hypothetical protein n=1 Tax=uncultured Variovorax sp. TaxID=114708 RepID=UPI002600B84F|nr:hypothetical protein [uncultured Variovorax sp.]